MIDMMIAIVVVIVTVAAAMMIIVIVVGHQVLRPTVAAALRMEVDTTQIATAIVDTAVRFVDLSVCASEHLNEKQQRCRMSFPFLLFTCLISQLHECR